VTPRQKAKKWNKPPRKNWLLSHDLEAFEIFFKTRHFTTVAREFKVSPAAVGQHAEKHGWIDRLTRRLTAIEEKVVDKLSDRVARDAARQYDILGLAEVNLMNFLKRPALKEGQYGKVSDVMMATSGMINSIKGKRLLAGESTEKVENVLTFKDVILKLHEAAGRKI